ncbi:uncharacterized protein LOC127122101 [Lathyrus oleraceus]|uniref:uncharacterized protein LOC127122101 n=1 Tax=Pisum sativum TaxID=3888 RepID=UPI0021D0CAFD|nr:uncharacterized protein LOC127122101 [Pisum sativum]
MSKHPSSSGTKPSQHAKTPSMEFEDEDVMDVTPLCMIPGDTTGPSSNAGDRQGNTSGNSSLPKDMYYADRAIRKLVTRILSEGHKVEGVSTPLSRREPSPEGEPHADKGDDSSRSEKEVAAEGFCSLEEGITEGEDDPLVHLVKPSVAEKLRTKKGKSVAKMRAARVKKTAGIGPSKPWSKVEVGKRKERDSFDSKEDVKDDVPDISPAKRQAVQKSPGKAVAVHLDNISFHLEDGAAKWTYVIQRRVAIERELGQEAIEVKEVIELIKNVGLVKTVVTLPQCYEGEPASQGSLIDQLRETCKELENGITVAKARKEALEVLICSLEREDIEKAGKDSNARPKSQSSGSFGSLEDSEGASEDTSEGESDASSSD